MCKQESASSKKASDGFGAEEDEVHEFEVEEKAYTVKKKKGTCSILLEYFKYIYSLVLLVFCVTMVMGCIFTGQSAAAGYNIPKWGAFFIFWFLICWLAMMEGGQGCLVGLQLIDKELYEDTHPRTLKNTKLAHLNSNMERFIVGRQFLVVLVIFLINFCGSAVENANPFASIPQDVNAIFLGNGVALMITTITIGQLPSQVNAAVCMLDFINNYFMLFTVYVSLAIEASGLLHCVYLVERGFSWLSGKTKEDKKEESFVEKILFWVRVLMSGGVLTFATAVTLEALIKNQSGMWEGVPVSASIVIFFLLLCIVGLMEGMQIAAFALVNLPDWELEQYPIVKKNCELMFSGQNLQSFLIGRQIFVATLMFIVAKIATINIGEGEENIFGVSNGFQAFLDTGLLGAVVLTIIGSLAWRVVASSFPIAFMSNPLIYVIINICLFLESIGICSIAWVLASIHKFIAGYTPDDVYLDVEEDTEDKLPVQSSMIRSSILMTKEADNRIGRLASIKINPNEAGASRRVSFVPMFASIRIDKPNLLLGFDDNEDELDPLAKRLSFRKSNIGKSFTSGKSFRKVEGINDAASDDDSNDI